MYAITIRGLEGSDVSQQLFPPCNKLDLMHNQAELPGFVLCKVPYNEARHPDVSG